MFLAAPKEIIGNRGQVKKLICEKMRMGDTDENGRRAPNPTGETFSIDVDMVIKAAGQMPFENLVRAANITNIHGKIVISKDGSTNLKGVFAGGDAVNGGREVVDAVQAGKIGAKGILQFLNIKN